MNTFIYRNEIALGRAAGEKAAQLIREAIANNGTANIILATGTSQFETLKALIAEDIQWNKVVMFHLDEYISLPITHPASFRKYLRERFLSQVSPLKDAWLINGEGGAHQECSRLSNLIRNHPIDVALIGIGENGHLAFNDPPADFETKQPYIVVDLDQKCRQQQVNEGWFSSIEEVPKQAISMSIQQIMLSKKIICTVPGKRKAEAVKCTVEGTVSNLCPASILQKHPECYLFIDEEAASLLENISPKK
ncbi:MAG: glucosamine-6-phosphate deaminase [Ginsengibacter sp.]